MKKVLLGIAVLLGVAGVLVLYGSNFAKQTVHDQLSAQKIKFPAKEALEKDNPALVKYAGAEVDTGDEAKAYSEYIKGHIAKIANNQTYSEVSGQYQQQKDKTTAEAKKLEGQRLSLFMGETLRGLLLNAWGWGLIGAIAFYAGITLLLGAVLVAIVALAMKESKPAAKKRATSKKK